MKIADETLDALFDMELPLPRPVVRSLAEGIDTILQKFANTLCPARTRFKPETILLHLSLGGVPSDAEGSASVRQCGIPFLVTGYPWTSTRYLLISAQSRHIPCQI